MRQISNWLLLFICLLMLMPSLAESTRETWRTAASAKNTIRVDGLDSSFRKNTMNLGFTVGAGVGTEVLGSTEEHDLVLFTSRFGWVFTNGLAEDKWYSGSPEVLGEITAGSQFEPNNRTVAGFSAGLRYSFTGGNFVVPYVDFALGLAYTDIEEPDLSTKFEFITQLGGGTHLFLDETTALTLQYRWFHLSNAGIEKPNRGTNTQMIHLGMSWFF